MNIGILFFSHVYRREEAGGGGGRGPKTRLVPQRETPLPTKLRESLDSKSWSEVVHDVWC